MREANDRIVLLAVLRQPGLSRLEVSKVTGLSPSAITGIIDRLMEQGFLLEGRREEPRRPSAGRPRAPLYLKPDARYVIGVAIETGGASVALATWTGQVIERREVAGGPGLLAHVHQAIREFVRPNLLGVGVSIPGNLALDTGRVRHATNLAWRDVDVSAALKGDLPLPFFYENNSDLAALAERWFQHSNAALENFVFVTLRVGIGTGIILNGQLVRGARNCAGEFGHTTLVPAGRLCLCGQRGCWEEYASDRALVRRYAEHGGTAALDSLGVVAAARQGDAAALQALEETAESLALGLCPLILGLNPSAIALDDWAAAGWDLIQGRVWSTIERRVPAAWREGVEIFATSHAADASLYGAFAVVLGRFITSFSLDAGGEAALGR